MLALSLAWALLAAPAAPAAAQPRCPDGGAPRLTGEPFRPLACGSGAPAAQAAVSTATLPDADAARADLRPLDGVWHGFVAFGGRRYEVTVTISSEGSRWAWRAADEQLHVTQELQAKVSRGLFAKPPYKVELTSPLAPGRSLSGRIWLGAAPLEADQHPKQDRLAVWIFDGRAPVQKIAYSLSGDRLSGVYTVADAARGRAATPFELDRAPKAAR